MYNTKNKKERQRSASNLFVSKIVMKKDSLPLARPSFYRTMDHMSNGFERSKQMQQINVESVQLNELNRLKYNFETAMSTAIECKLQSTRDKQQVTATQLNKVLLESKVNALSTQLTKCYSKIQEQRKQIVSFLQQQIVYKLNQQQSSKTIKKLQQQLKSRKQELEQLNVCLHQLIQIDVLRQRIVELEREVREKTKSVHQHQLKQVQLQKKVEQLQKSLRNTKPHLQQLQQKIRYWQRVNLDLQRKMQDYNRRENEYNKQILQLKKNLKASEAECDKFTSLYNQTLGSLHSTQSQLQITTVAYNELIHNHEAAKITISDQEAQINKLKDNIHQQTLFYQRQGKQNQQLVKINRLLQQHTQSLQNNIQINITTTHSVNVYMVNIEQKHKNTLKLIKQTNILLQESEEKYLKFDQCINQDNSASILKEGLYHFMRENNKLTLMLKQNECQLNAKVLSMGEERDHINISLNKEIQNNKLLTNRINANTTEDIYLSIIKQKTQSNILMESSNDQLLKIKRQNQDRIIKLQSELENEKKEVYILRLKAADLFKAKKQIEQLRKNQQRYHQMIQSQREMINDLQSQMQIMRAKTLLLSDNNFVLEQQKKQLAQEIREKVGLMLSLNVDKLQEHKQMNDRNSHMLQDALQKCNAGLKSLQHFFNCCFCGEGLTTVVTVPLCGHCYCAKCKDAFSEQCFECDNGLPIDKPFNNRYMKDAVNKFRFLSLVLQQLNTEFQISP